MIMLKDSVIEEILKFLDQCEGILLIQSVPLSLSLSLFPFHQHMGAMYYQWWNSLWNRIRSQWVKTLSLMKLASSNQCL